MLKGGNDKQFCYIAAPILFRSATERKCKIKVVEPFL
jgi:hypothetical protein